MKKFLIRAISFACLLSSFSVFSAINLRIDTNKGESLSFTYEQLQSLEQTTFDTITPWTTETSSYSGPSLKLLLSSFPKNYKKIEVYALNGFFAVITADQIKHHNYLFAIAKDQKPMSVRDKGPYWILLDFSRHPNYMEDTDLQSGLVWQIKRINIIY